MRNIITRVEDGKLYITVDLGQLGIISKSGKSTVIASTEGNVSVPENPEIKMGINIYRSVG